MKSRAKVLFQKICCSDKAGKVGAAYRIAKLSRSEAQAVVAHPFTSLTEIMSKTYTTASNLLTASDVLCCTLTAMASLWRQLQKSEGETRSGIASDTVLAIKGTSVPKGLDRLLAQASQGRPTYFSG